MAKGRVMKRRWMLVALVVLIPATPLLFVASYELETNQRIAGAEKTLHRLGYSTSEPKPKPSDPKLRELVDWWTASGLSNKAPRGVEPGKVVNAPLITYVHANAQALDPLTQASQLDATTKLAPDDATMVKEWLYNLRLAALVDQKEVRFNAAIQRIDAMARLVDIGRRSERWQTTLLTDETDAVWACLELASRTPSLANRKLLREKLVAVQRHRDLHGELQGAIYELQGPQWWEEFKHPEDKEIRILSSLAATRNRVRAVQMEYLADFALAAEDSRLTEKEADDLRKKHEQYTEWPVAPLLNKVSDLYLLMPEWEGCEDRFAMDRLKMDLLIEFAGGEKAVVPTGFTVRRMNDQATIFYGPDKVSDVRKNLVTW